MCSSALNRDSASFCGFFSSRTAEVLPPRSHENSQSCLRSRRSSQTVSVQARRQTVSVQARRRPSTAPALAIAHDLLSSVRIAGPLRAALLACNRCTAAKPRAKKHWPKPQNSLASRVRNAYFARCPISHVPVAVCRSVGIRTRGRTAA
jgi:hypothetical protein